MKNSNGRAVPNQFIIVEDDGTTWFQSYNSMIAVMRLDGKIELDRTYWNYSTTTGKYRNIFLSETKRETEKKIKSGQYVLTDLN
jgi:hypothetical protein